MDTKQELPGDWKHMEQINTDATMYFRCSSIDMGMWYDEDYGDFGIVPHDNRDSVNLNLKNLSQTNDEQILNLMKLLG